MKGNTSTVKRSMASGDHCSDQNDYLFNSEGIKISNSKNYFFKINPWENLISFSSYYLFSFGKLGIRLPSVIVTYS